MSRTLWNALVICSLIVGHVACGEEGTEGEALASGATNTSGGDAAPGAVKQAKAPATGFGRAGMPRSGLRARANRGSKPILSRGAERKAHVIVEGRRADSASGRGLCAEYGKDAMVYVTRYVSRGGSYLQILGGTTGRERKRVREFSKEKAIKDALSAEKAWVNDELSWARRHFDRDASHLFTAILESYLHDVSSLDIHSLCRTPVSPHRASSVPASPTRAPEPPSSPGGNRPASAKPAPP